MSSCYWDPELIQRYDRQGPRYTSYPTAVEFHEGIDRPLLAQAALESQASERPLSLYFHIPFCARLCYYCACNKVVTKRRERARPYLDRLKEEVALQAAAFGGDRLVEQLHWGGGTPTFLSPDEMRELMAWTRQHFSFVEAEALDCSIEVDPREMEEGRLDVLRELGFNRISLGVQDIDPIVQKAVNRIQPNELSQQLIRESRERGFRSVSIDLIYGLPHQTIDGFARTVEEVIRWSPDRLSIFNYAHLPQRFAPQKRIREEDLPSPAEKLRMLENTISQLVEAGYQYIGMDHFAKPQDSLARAAESGRLHRNFQGYTTHGNCDLLGFGVSAISMLDGYYYQNTTDIARYEESLTAGKLPVVRGVALTEDDRMRRSIIHDLICHFQLDVAKVESHWSIRFSEYFQRELEELAAMHEDGLIQLDANYNITVNAPGRLLIRVVCQVFDHYRQVDTEQPRFSRVI